MTITPTDIAINKADLAIGLAAGAWEYFCASTGRRFSPPTAVVSLKAQRLARKSGVYRLEWSDDGHAVVAKRCFRSDGIVERAVHERILPQLNVAMVRYIGYFEEPDSDFCWLFMEDAAGTKLLESDRVLAAQWLARLHASAVTLADEVPLPERGAAHYREHLQSVRVMLVEALRQSTLSHDDREVLRALYELAEKLNASWERTCVPCASAPRTLVHGDFGRKNLRIRHDPTGRAELVALDWETAGWGPPAADIPHTPRRAPPRKPHNGVPRWRGTVPLEVYALHVGDRWSGAAFEDLMRLARVGTVFRTVASMRWALEQLRAGGIDKGMSKLRWDVEDLRRTLVAVDW